jgi:hypothetical protein
VETATKPAPAWNRCSTGGNQPAREWSAIMTRRAGGRLATLPLLAGLALLLAGLLAGCGKQEGSGEVASAAGQSGAGATTPPPSLSPQEKALKFAQCMREHGVDMPDPDPADGGNIRIGGPGIDQTKLQAAAEACKQFSPLGDGPGKLDPAQLENVRKFAQCMRQNGVPNFPDPDGGRILVDKSVGSDPDFPAAQRTCEKAFLPGAQTGGR